MVSRLRVARGALRPGVDAVMHFREMVDEMEDHLDARQVDAQVALIGHDRPEPADLRGFIAFHRALVGGLHQAQRLVAREHLGRDGQCLAARSRGMIRRVMADALPF